MKTFTKGLLMLVAAGAITAPAALAGSPSVFVQSKTDHGRRRVEIVVEDTARSAEVEPEGLPAVMISPPDGARIKGTLQVHGAWFAVTADKLLAVGQNICGLRIAEISIDHVRLAGTVRTYEMEVASGEWSASEEIAAAE